MPSRGACSRDRHGWAKVTGKPMGVLVACECRPDARDDGDLQRVLRSRADAGHRRRRPDGRRPRISPAHWYHSVLDQGALVRDYVKWDDQPFSLRGTLEALLRANQLTRTVPMAPCYVSIDQRMQEDPLPDQLVARDVARYAPAVPFRPDGDAVRRAAEMLVGAANPVILAGPRFARRDRMDRAHRARRSARRRRDHRHEGRRGVSDRSSAASRRSDARVRRREKPARRFAAPTSS